MTEFMCVECGEVVSKEWITENELVVPLCANCLERCKRNEESFGAGGYS